jgi:glycosyltransferase involved in cell wall biosynthesis
MPDFHIITHRQLNLAQQTQQAAIGESPRHAIQLLADELNAAIYEPDGSPASVTDRWRAFVAPPPALWTLARRVRSAALPGDVVFCMSEGGGLQLAAVCPYGPLRPGIVVFVHNIDRPRARFALRWWRMVRKIDLFLACSENQVDFLRQFLNLPEDRVQHIWDHTDTHFFSPGQQSPTKKKRLVVSVGLEQRDYTTLAKATCELDIDVRISGFSKDAGTVANALPETLPANMSMRFYQWPELVQLYRDADVVVVSCHQNKYAAGVQSLMEAMACKRPIVATTTYGLKEYLNPFIIAVPPDDIQAMRDAICHLLSDPANAETRAASGHELALQRHSMERYVHDVAKAVRRLRRNEAA